MGVWVNSAYLFPETNRGFGILEKESMARLKNLSTTIKKSLVHWVNK